MHILDLMLPGLNGFDLLAKIRDSRPELLSRVIVLTAVSTSLLQTFPFTPLVWRVIRKPFDLDEFWSALLDCTSCHSDRMVPSHASLAQWFDRQSIAFGAKAGVIAVAADRALRVRAEFGFAAGLTNEVFPLPLQQNYPLAIAFRTRKPVWFASLTLARADYPLLLPIWIANQSQAIAAVPLAAHDETVGAIGWSFDQPQPFDEEHRHALLRISSECVALLSRESDTGSRAQPQA